MKNEELKEIVRPLIGDVDVIASYADKNCDIVVWSMETSHCRLQRHVVGVRRFDDIWNSWDGRDVEHSKTVQELQIVG